MQTLITTYQSNLKSHGDPAEAYKWDAINHFQEHWYIEADNFEEMFLEAFRKKENLMYQNSWGFIRNAVMHFPEKVRAMFRELYNEKTPVEDRIKAFQIAAKAILPDLKEAVGKENFQTQQDERTLSVYLSFRYPEVYYLYKYSVYEELCKTLNVKIAPSGSRFIHYMQLAEDVKTKHISNNAALQKVHEDIYPKTSWNTDNLIAQNMFYTMLEGKERSFSNDITVPGEKEFYDIIHSHERQDVEDFFEYLDAIITHFDIQAEDVRVVTGTTKKRLNLTIGQRYCWNLFKPKSKNGIFGLISVETINDDSSKYDGNGLQPFYTYFNDYNIALENRDKAFAAIQKELGRTTKSSFTEHNNDAFRKAIFDKDYRNYILDNPNLTLDEASPMETPKPITAVNKILYGPPGTGKTYKLKQGYFPKYTLREVSLTKETFFEETVRDLTWWQVIGLALLETGTSKVSDILANRWVSEKAKLSESKNVRATIWGTLQMHTVQESETVAYKQRQIPLIFDKTKDKKWQLFESELQEQFPELYDIRDSVNNFAPNPHREIKHYVFTTFHQSFAYEDFIEGIKPKLDSPGSDKSDLEYEIKDGVFKALCIRAQTDPDNRYAIFIDEINRGNVSAIFGELITLIEPDKRLGAKHEIKVRLPYSKTDFGVPSNVDIYGTMNTADRSVEALDTALRRRFSFKEIMPDPSLLRDKTFNGFNLSEVLQTINERIEFLLDRDHTIGHSYFLDLERGDTEGLKAVFKNKVIPLLQEYFYHDYEKIALILGSGFVNVKTNHSITFPAFDGISAPDSITLCELVQDIEDIEKAVTTLLDRPNYLS